MIIPSANLPVERGGDMPESTFRIKASAKAFRILSDGLYSNKILAVIREYFCNAWDAHVAAGNVQTPIEVHLPNNFEPYFSVKDYGVGISHEDVLNIYTTYFESTKTSSNDQIGGLGIGGKAFFCYADSFMVISRFNGVKRTYTAFINEQELPSIALMSEEPTDEPNGLEVSGSVKPSDFYSFETNARTFFARVSPMPIFKGNPNFSPNGVSYTTMDGKGWKLRTGSGSAVAVMGVVGYPLNPDRSQLTPKQCKVLDLPIDIDFGIGDIDVAANRENISFTKNSLANLAARLDLIHDEIVTRISDHFTGCKNMWDAKIMLWRLISGELNKFRGLIDVSGILWNGQKLTLGNLHLGAGSGVLDCTQFVRSGKKIVRRNTKEIEVTANTVFFINDLNTGTITRVRYHINNVAPNANVYVLQVTSEADALVALGKQGDTLGRASDLPKPPRGVYGATEKGKAQALVLNLDGDSRYAADYWDLVDEDFDLADGGIYVPLERYDVFGVSPKKYIQDKLDELGTIGLDLSTIEVIGLKRKLQDKVANNPKWVRLDAYITEQVKTKLSDATVAPKLANHDQVEKFDSQFEWVKALAKELPNVPTVKEIMDKRELMKADAKALKCADTWRSIANNFGISLAPADPAFDLTGDVQKLLAEHPILGIASYAHSGWSTNDVFAKFKDQIAAALGVK